MRAILSILLCFLLAAGSMAEPRKRTSKPAPSKPRTMENVRSEKRANEKKVAETQQKLKANSRQVKKELNTLNTLGAEIKKSEEQLAIYNRDLSGIRTRHQLTSDSITRLEKQIAKMRAAYIRTLKQSQAQTSGLNRIAYIFSSKSWHQAAARVRYIQQFSRWRQRKARELQTAATQLGQKKASLGVLQSQAESTVAKAQKEQSRLASNRSQAEKKVRGLQSQGSALQKELDQRRRQAQALDRELDRLIAQEQERQRREQERLQRQRQEQERLQREKEKAQSTKPSKEKTPVPEKPSKPAPAKRVPAPDAALSGSFAQNQGRLPFPVAGSYRVVKGFGRQPHPTLPGVETENSGIDIETAGGSAVRSIFDGTVSAIFRQDGFNSIVMVRHGSYISIYAGLGTVAVRQGDKVKSRQTIGSLYSDPDNSNRGTLHFEIRNERSKLNPSAWVR